MSTHLVAHAGGAPKASLLELYAQLLGIPPANAARRLFYECVPPWRRGFICLHRWFRPRLYVSDQRLVQEAGLAHGRQEVMNAIDRWQHRESSTHAWERDLLGWRLSSRRLMAITRSIFHAVEESAPGSAKPLTVPPGSTRTDVAVAVHRHG